MFSYLGSYGFHSLHRHRDRGLVGMDETVISYHTSKRVTDMGEIGSWRRLGRSLTLGYWFICIVLARLLVQAFKRFG